MGLNDVPTLAPVCLALAGTAGALRRGRTLDFAVAGIGLGLACATKYTGGIVLLPLVAAAVHRRRLMPLVLAGVLAAVAFLVANPYALITPGALWDGITHQSDAASEVGGKLGLTANSGFSYYAWTLTWGLGWVPALAAAGGAVALAVRDRPAFWALVPAPVAFLLFMGTQERYFGRWLMPILPILCLLAAYLAVTLVVAAARRRPALAPALATLAVVALCLQGLISSLHIGRTLSQEDTRNQARAWLVDHVRKGTRMVVEPVVPDAWATDVGSGAGARWVKWPGLRARYDEHGRPYPEAERPVMNIEDYERTLQPELIDDYVAAGYCWVVSGSTQSGRAKADPQDVPGAIAYYDRLRRDGDLVFRATPYRDGAGPVRFSFDWSFDFYPLAYERPGPTMEVYRLHGAGCQR
jgi:4-amino-4-deoxy-L-arabinose transferase-like glycosyltransferase